MGVGPHADYSGDNNRAGRMGGNTSGSRMDNEPGISRTGSDNQAGRMGGSNAATPFPNSIDDNTWTNHAMAMVLSTTTCASTLPPQLGNATL